MEKVKSEKGFTLLELIMVMVVTGIISSTLVLPFISGIKQGTRPEIYATATYLAQKEIEEFRNAGYTNIVDGSHLGTDTSSVTFYPGTPREITYTEGSIREYVSYSGGTFVTTGGTPTEFIRVTETVSNSENADVVAFWSILAKDFYDTDPPP